MKSDVSAPEQSREGEGRAAANTDREVWRVELDYTSAALAAAVDARPAPTPDPRDAALKAAEALAVCCAAVDCYSRDELAEMGRAMMEQFRAEALSNPTGGR